MDEIREDIQAPWDTIPHRFRLLRILGHRVLTDLAIGRGRTLMGDGDGWESGPPR